MTTYYGDDTDLGDRFEADQQMAELERIGRRWAAFRTTAIHLDEHHADEAAVPTFARAERGDCEREEAFDVIKAEHVRHHVHGTPDHTHKWVAKAAHKYHGGAAGSFAAEGCALCPADS